MLKKDKAKVLDDVWTQDHIKSFLSVRPHDGSDEDFHMLHKAYQSMRAADFEVFVGFFGSENRNINATSLQDHTVLSIIGEHRHGEEYAVILRAAGAL